MKSPERRNSKQEKDDDGKFRKRCASILHNDEDDESRLIDIQKGRKIKKDNTGLSVREKHYKPQK